MLLSTKTKTNFSYIMRRVAVLRLILVLIFLALLTACGEREVLKVSTEADALEIVEVLSKYNIESVKREMGEDEQKEWVIIVSDDVDFALVSQILSDHSLPRPKEDTGSSSSILVETGEERKQKELRVKKRDVERQLRQLPGVTSADITIVPSEDPYFKVEPVPAKANVVLRYKENKPLEENVKLMVSSSVERLAAADVNVTLIPVPQRAIPQLKANGKRNNLLLAIGIGLVAIIPFLLVVLILQNRRKQNLMARLNPAVAIADENAGVGLLQTDGGAKLIDKKPANLLKEGVEKSLAPQDAKDEG